MAISEALSLEAACPASCSQNVYNAPMYQILTQSGNARLSYQIFSKFSLRGAICRLSLLLGVEWTELHQV